MFALVVVLSVALSAPAGDERPSAGAKVDFMRDIEPILARSCVSCHGPQKQKGGLRLDRADDAFKGGNSGPVIRPKASTESRLVHAVAGTDPELSMPPQGKKLTAQEVTLVRTWIDQGAQWPRAGAARETARVQSSHWSFQPIVRTPLPRVANTAWVRNGIDAFVLARLEAEKIMPSPEAERATLLRRLSLDLLGLSPEPQVVDAFVADQRPDAYERLVDQLLASPHYGERWGRHWLDVARYADSDGYEKDNQRPFAWRYRQWVIEALNRNLAFDQFTIEQLAGDLLPNATLEQKIATGFHRNTLTNTEGGVDKEQFRVEAVIDRVNTTARAFLGLTMGCVQCHDHKYDPFSQREYYQLFAYFNSDVETNIPAALEHEVKPYEQKKAAHNKKLKQLEANRDAFRNKELPARQEKWERALKAEDRNALPAEVAEALAVAADQRTAKQKKAVADHYATIDEQLTKLNRAIATHQRQAPALTQAPTLALGSPRKTNVLIRGDFLRPGAEVEPCTPAVLAPLTVPAKPTRLDLARWLVNDSQPLTPRVVANWVWHKYFGRGLVATLEDFGTQGEKPSHPELLDWLAAELMRRQWDLKDFHRLIVTSATYRQSSRQRPELEGRDPLNILLARQRRLRLEGELVRDAALAASGLLYRMIGGPSVRPPQPAGISEITYAGGAKWPESTGPNRYRRGLYTWFQRTSPYPMLTTFDAPESILCCVRRERSNTPLQALTLLNDTVFVECAQALGRRIVQEPVHERPRYAFRACLSREPTVNELGRLQRLYDELLLECRVQGSPVAELAGAVRLPGTKTPASAACVAFARALMNLDEFITRE